MNWQISFLLTITKSSKISLTARLFECVLRRHTSPFVLGLRMIHHHFRGSDIYILCASHKVYRSANQQRQIANKSDAHTYSPRSLCAQLFLFSIQCSYSQSM
eukprot:COSAG01_NODE_4633_length_4853_cov_6.538332_3_plen_102_part_00